MTMNKRLRRAPPKHRLAHRSGNATRPMATPSGANTITPFRVGPEPQPAQTLPSVSQRMPSGRPWSPASTKTRPWVSVPPSATSYTRMRFGLEPLSTTYSRRSSGEKHSPFGFGTSCTTASIRPLAGSSR
ncbi:hypothetical protein D3C72_1614000 [compost metagenome]